VTIDGQDLYAATSSELYRFRNLRMGFVFQFHNLLPELSALENVLMPALKSGREADRRPLAVSFLDEFGLSDKHGHLPSQLSGGEQQRVAIARALVMEPRYHFADEPTGNLDSANGATVLRLFQRINRERKMAVVFVTHDAEFARLASRQIRMADGCLVNDT
jgi:putative ABC transport system ATP-binding protein/lipoprotein-releasing system ATP-binding protein